jgi:aminocarboxymuconate-semialdehyde decarboxylase
MSVTSLPDEASPAVDWHAHIVPDGLVHKLVDGSLAFPNVRVEIADGRPRFGFADAALTRPARADLSDLTARLAWMAESGVDRQVIGPWLDIAGYALPGAEGAEWAAAVTDEIVAATSGSDRLRAFGTVAMQDPARAAEGLRRLRADGLPGVMIGTQINGVDLDDARFEPFWQAADETAACVFLHPGFGAGSARYADFGLVNGLSRLSDSTVALARMLYAGIPERYARARILVAHGGGALPYALGRLIQNHLVNPKTTADPVPSFQRLFFDSVVFDEAVLEFLVRKVGAPQVILGSDYPFPIGDLKPLGVVRRSALSEVDQTTILTSPALTAENGGSR